MSKTIVNFDIFFLIYPHACILKTFQTNNCCSKEMGDDLEGKFVKGYGVGD